jgi:hypothetical protein
VSIFGNELDPDDRLTALTVCEQELAAAAERALVLDDVLAKLEKTISDDAAAPAQPTPDEADPEFDLALRRRCYREAALPLATLAGPITRSLADFLG